MSLELLKKVDDAIDTTFQYTGLPQLSGGFAGLIGSGIDKVAGTNVEPTLRSIGEGLPRAVTEAALTIPEAASGAGAPLAAATWLSRLRKLGMVAGYGSTALHGTVETQSPLGGLIAAGSLGLGNKLLLPEALGGLDVGGRAAAATSRFLERGTPDIVAEEAANVLTPRPTIEAATALQRTLPVAARLGADVGTMTGLNEVTRQAEMSVGPNAVPLDDPSRNPFTPENAAGALAGGLMFAPQAVEGFLNRPRLVPKQVEQMRRWIETRKDAERAYRGYDWEGPVSPEMYHDTFGTTDGAPAFRGKDLVPPEEYWTPENFDLKLKDAVGAPSDFDKLHVALRTQLDALQQQDAEGQIDLAGKTRQSIQNILQGMPQVADSEQMQTVAKTLDAQARQMPPEDAKGFAKFVQDLNGLIDQINENTAEFPEEMKTEKAKGQTWHPEARSTLVTGRLQEKGLLPKITPEWLKENFNAEFNESGDPQFAYQVVLQKAANRVFDSLPSALAQEKATPTLVQVLPDELSSRAQKRYASLDAETTKFIDALNTLPSDVRDGVIARTAEVFSKQPYISKQGQTAGRLVGMDSSWRKAVIRAMETYAPESQTSLLYNSTTRKFERKPLKYLFLRDENGDYLWSPATSAVPVAEGGKPKVGGRPETNLSDVVPEGKSPDEVLDEESYKAALAQEGIGGSLQMKTEAGLGEGKAGEEVKPEGGQTAPEFLTTSEGKSATAKIQERNKSLETSMKSLNDDQLYRAVQDVFARRGASGVGAGVDQMRGYRKSGALRAAIEAVRENFASLGDESTPVGPAGKKFLEMESGRGLKLAPGTEKKQLRVQLLSFFKATDTEGLLGQVGKVVERLTDPKVVEMVKQGTEARPSDAETTTTKSDLFVNTQPPGAFVEDVIRTLRTKFSQVLGTEGYSGTLRDLYTEMAVALAKQIDRVPTDFYSIVGKEWGLAKAEDGRGKLGLRLDETVVPGQETKYVNRVLAVLAHEISHIDSFVLEGLIDAPDAYSEQRRRHLENLRSLGNVLSVDEREAILTTLRDGFWPKDVQYDIRVGDDKRLYGSHSPDEFVSTVNELLAASLLRGKSTGMKSVLDVLDYGPTEVREFARGTYRSIADVLSALKDTVSDPSIRTMLGKPDLPSVNPFLTSEAFHAVVNAAREGSALRNSDFVLAQARSAMASLSPGAAGALPMASPALWFRTGKDIQENYVPGTDLHTRAMPTETTADAINVAKDYFRPTDKSKPGLWARWFYPFQNLMLSMERSGVPLARPVANLALDLQAGVSRTRTQMLSPFLVTAPDGKVHWDQHNLLLQKVSSEKNGPWRKAVNEVSSWQQEVGAQPMFVRGGNGELVPNPDPKLKAAEKWDQIRKSLSPQDQQVVQAASVGLDQVGQIAAQRLVATIDVSNRHRVSALLMAMNPGMTYDNAMGVADVVVGSYLKGDVASVDRTGLAPQQRAQVESLLLGPDGLLQKFKDVSDQLLNRPGFRTESLPGDYVIRFKTPEGDIKFLSADSKGRANFLARRLEREGNTIAGEIVHKDELKNYTDFDAPDTILSKFVEVENDVWQRFLRQLENAQPGLFNQGMVDALKGYTPGAQTMKETATKGMNRFLAERESRVDRSRYDYIDGTFSWVGRLASSMEYKTTRQMKELILSDPRAKAFPSFRGMVDPFFDNLMTPTSQAAKELKTFATAYMMGGSLASAVINGTQSAVTLVPTLIQLGQGGPVKAYKDLGKAIAKAASVSTDKSWQRLASEAEKLDPKEWSLEQAQAALYKRNLSEGGIQQGIIQDNIFTPTDQRVAMVQKFGHGDYGPTTVGEMARSGVYTAAQLSLKPFGWVESFNNKVSLFAGVTQGYEKGLRGEALYDHAKLVKTLSTFGGGKANVPGLVPRLSTPYTRSAVGIVNTLQQYGYGVVASYGQLLKDSLGKSEGLSPIERRQAQKALATMTATQVAVAGALGLPFAGATLAVLENVFGVPANQLVRQGLASLGEDDSQGAAIAETALNGLGNQMFGLDLSSRAGVTNVAGTSSYRGFNLADMAGPVGSIVQNAGQALGWFGQGEPMKAARALVPNSLKTLVDLTDSKAKYGDYGIRDSGDNLLYQPSPSEAALYLLGFRPREVSEKRQAQKLLTFANTRATRGRGRDLDSASERLLDGDPSVAVGLAQNMKYADPTVDAQAVLRSVVQRAVDSSTEKDLLASGPTANEAERQQIAGTFQPGVVSRQSEVQRAALAARLGMQVGLEPDPNSFSRAAMVDALVQRTGMPRSQALRLVEFLQ